MKVGIGAGTAGVTNLRMLGAGGTDTGVPEGLGTGIVIGTGIETRVALFCVDEMGW